MQSALIKYPQWTQKCRNDSKDTKSLYIHILEVNTPHPFGCYITLCANRSKFGGNQSRLLQNREWHIGIRGVLGCRIHLPFCWQNVKPMSSPYWAQPVATMEECAKNSKCLHLKQRQNSQNKDCSAKLWIYNERLLSPATIPTDRSTCPSPYYRKPQFVCTCWKCSASACERSSETVMTSGFTWPL